MRIRIAEDTEKWGKVTKPKWILGRALRRPPIDALVARLWIRWTAERPRNSYALVGGFSCQHIMADSSRTSASARTEITPPSFSNHPRYGILIFPRNQRTVLADGEDRMAFMRKGVEREIERRQKAASERKPAPRERPR